MNALNLIEEVKGKKVIILAELKLKGNLAKGNYCSMVLAKKLNGSIEYCFLRNKNTKLLELSDSDRNMKGF
jgi:hypothetical protein